jgi:hypothetical protein
LIDVFFLQVPLMAERMLDLPIGGIDDMAVWTGFVWERIARWLDHGPPPNPEPRDPSEAAAIAAAIAGEEEEDRGGAWMRRFLRLARASAGETRVPFCPPKATTLVLRKRQFATTGSGQAGRKLKTKGVSAQCLTIGSASCGCSRRALRTPCHPSAGQILQTTTAAAPAAAAAAAAAAALMVTVMVMVMVMVVVRG